MQNYNLTYITTDSIQEGVGSSQIVPLLKLLSEAQLKVNLISYEKRLPPSDLIDEFSILGINWDFKNFNSTSFLDPIKRYRELIGSIPKTELIHGRSDIPTLAGINSKIAPVLWDVRSLWADQRKFIEKNRLRKAAASVFRLAEKKSATGASGLSTLTKRVVPILDLRYPSLTQIREVIPTCTDLNLFSPSTKGNSIQGLYSGTYNNYYDLELSKKFIDALRSLAPLSITWARPEESPHSKLDGGEDSIISVSQNEMATVIPNFNFGLSICKSYAGISLAAAVPTKIGEFLACGVPVVVNSGLGDCDDYIEQRGVGIVLNDIDSIESQALKFMTLLTSNQTAKKCRAVAEELFDIRRGAEKYLSLYNRILNGKIN
jgi:hypothetical protein